MFKRLLPLILLLTCLLPLAGGPATAQPDDLPDVTLFLGFIPNIQFAPVYVALQRGYFASEAGVNVVLEYGDENLGVERIAAGELSFGVVSGEQVILARAGGRPVVYVYEWYQRFPVGIAAPAGSGIESAADLAGRAVGVPGRFGASYIGLRALLAASGLTEDDLLLEEIGYNAPAMLCAGRVEAAVVYTANEPVTIREQCTDVNVIDIWPLADLLANGLITNEQTIAENPDRVRGMVRALAMGIADTIADPDTALDLSRGYVETLTQGAGRIETSIAASTVQRALADAATSGATLTPEQADELAALLSTVLDANEVVQMRVLRNAINLWRTDIPGYTDPDSWQVTLDTLVLTGLLPEPFDLNGAYTNEFLP